MNLARIEDAKITRRDRLIEYMLANKGKWLSRDRIIYACHFGSMRVDPCSVWFHNAIIRAKPKLARKGLKIVQSEDGEQVFSLQAEGYGK
jgi:hypothetical protein